MGCGIKSVREQMEREEAERDCPKCGPAIRRREAEKKRQEEMETLLGKLTDDKIKKIKILLDLMEK